MRGPKKLTLVYINQPMLKLVSLFIASVKVTEPMDDIMWGLAVFYNTLCCLNVPLLSMNGSYHTQIS